MFFLGFYGNFYKSRPNKKQNKNNKSNLKAIKIN